MFKSILEFFGIYDKPKTKSAPVSVEPVKAPEPPKCGCGRSPTGNCVGLHKLSDEEWAVNENNPNKVEAPKVEQQSVTAKPTAVKKPRAKKANAKK